MNKTIKISLIAATMTLLAACNTVAGAGRDVSSVGHATTKAAQPAN